jgi:group I intron endonuclease
MKTISWYGFTVYEHNVPEERPGIYLIQNIENKLAYIGISNNVARRCRQHTKGGSNGSKLGRAIYEEGRKTFLICPILYNLQGIAGLAHAEKELISSFNSIANGYNVVAASNGIGHFGPAFSRINKAAHNTKEYLAQVSKTWADPKLKRRHSKALRIALNRPETRIKLRARRRPIVTTEMRKDMSERMIKTQGTPAAKKRIIKHNRAMAKDKGWIKRNLEITQDPKRNAKIAAARIGGIWINNDMTVAFLPANRPIPEGWKKGRKTPQIPKAITVNPLLSQGPVK